MKWPFSNPFRLRDEWVTSVDDRGHRPVIWTGSPGARLSMNYLERAAIRPEDMGYRLVSYDWAFSAVFARPWAVWAICKLGYWLKSGWSRLVNAAWRLEFIRFTCEDVAVPRWYETRPGRRWLHPWRKPNVVRLSRGNWGWWFDNYWFHHKIRLLCRLDLYFHGHTWRDTKRVLDGTRFEPLLFRLGVEAAARRAARSKED